MNFFCLEYKSMNDPWVDIVILNHNGKKYLDGCLQSVLKSSYENKRIYILDNASTDDDVKYVKKNYPLVEIIQNPYNNGYCAAYNLAFKSCESPYILCLNNDVEVSVNWLEPMMALMVSNVKVGAIQPKILSYYDHNSFEYAGASGGFMDCYGFPFLRGRIFDTIEKDTGQYDKSIDIFWASGAAILLRKEAINYSGNFDETIVHHMDEIDLCWRLHLVGYQIKVEPQAVIYHIGGATITPFSFKKTYWNHRNSLYMMFKNYGIYHIMTKIPIHIIFDYIAMFQFLFTRRFQAAKGILLAHVWLLLNIRLIYQKRKDIQTMRKVSDQMIQEKLYNGSIVWQYFVLKKKHFTQIKNKY